MPAAPDCAALRPSTAFLGKRLSASGDILSVRVRVPTGGFLKGRKAVALKKSARSRAVAQGSSPLRSTILVCPRSLLWDHIVIARQSDRGDLPFDLHFIETFGHLPCTAWRPARSKTPRITSLLCACAREAGYGDLPLDSIIWRHHGQFACSARMPA